MSGHRGGSLVSRALAGEVFLPSWRCRTCWHDKHDSRGVIMEGDLDGWCFGCVPCAQRAFFVPFTAIVVVVLMLTLVALPMAKASLAAKAEERARQVAPPAETFVPPAMPSCHEDEVVVGVGDFDAGYWDAYVCQHFE